MFQKKSSRRSRVRDKHIINANVTSPVIIMAKVVGTGKSIFQLLLMMLAVGGVFYIGKGAWLRFFVHNTDDFGLRHLEISTMEGEPTVLLTEARVGEVTGLRSDGKQTVFQFQASVIEEKLTALPEIRAARASCRYPSTFRIKVEERLPIAWLVCPVLGLEERNREHGLLLDEQGVPFLCSSQVIWAFATELPSIYLKDAPEEEIIPGQKVASEGIHRALVLIQGLSEALADPTSLDPAREGERIPGFKPDAPDWVMIKDEITLDARTRNGIRATFSYFDQEKQLERLRKLQHHARSKNRQLAHVNLIPDRLVPVRYR